MEKFTLVMTVLGLFMVVNAQAAERSFRIHTTKSITDKVTRFYGQDSIGFATVFCNPDVGQVMMVDSRIRELDGKTFFFSSPAVCRTAVERAERLNHRCAVNLVIDTTATKAHLDTATCGE